MNTPVSFELAKLLKEKTFPQPKTTFETQQLGNCILGIFIDFRNDGR